MSMSDYSVRRPITVLMIALSIVVLGLISLDRLPLALIPDISSNNLRVSVSYPSSSPVEVERDITRPLEEVLATLDNLETIESTSSGTGSSVRVEFKNDTDMDLASLEVRDRIDQVRGRLPDEVDRIRIFRFQSSDIPIYRFSVGWNGDRTGLYNFLEDILRPQIERIPGVANVETRGIDDKEIRIEVDPIRLLGHGIDIFSLNQALRANNMNLSGGYVVDGNRKYTLRTVGEFRDLEEIRNFPLLGTQVTLGDIAEIKYDFPERDSFDRLNGNEAVSVRIYKASTANIVEVCDNVAQALTNLQRDPQYQTMLTIQVISDQSREILKSIQDLGQAGIIGGVLASVVLFLFLLKMRSTLIISIAIPVSIIFTFAFMYVLRTGFGSTININLVSLMGLMVAVGMLVDSSVVVLENVFRFKQQKGYSSIDAAIAGTKEVGVAVLASTATTVAVFASFLFVEGPMSRYLNDFGTTVSAALLASMLVALTLVPMLCSRIFTGKEKPKQKSLVALTNIYGGIMGWLLRYRFIALFIMIGLGWGSYHLITALDREEMPRVAERRVRMNVLFERSYSLDEIERTFMQLENILLERREEFEIESVASDLSSRTSRRGQYRGELDVYLIDEGKITPTHQIQQKIRTVLPSIAGVEYQQGRRRHYGGGGEMGIDVRLKGEDPALLEIYGEMVRNKLLDLQEVEDVQTTLETGEDEIHVEVDRRRTEQFGISPLMVARTLSSALSTRPTTQIKTDQGEIDIVVQLRGGNNISRQEIENLQFENRRGEMVPLYAMVNYQYRKGPLSIRRENRKATLDVMASLRSGASVFMTNMAVQGLMSEIILPPGYSWELGRSWRRFRQSEESNFFAIILALILMYIIMASLFESFIHPFTILFTVPFSIIGVATLFYLTGTSMNSFSYLGILVLFGLVVNNGIILVDHINNMRRQGLERDLAIIQGGMDRLRPILMTACTSLFGLLPLTLPFLVPDLFPAVEGRARMWAPVSLAVFGGLTTSTFLTLIVLPTVYSCMDDISRGSIYVLSKAISLRGTHNEEGIET